MICTSKNNQALYIIGCGGHARSVADVALSTGWRRIIFIDNKRRLGELVLGFQIIDEIPKDISGITFFVAIGDNHLRGTLYEIYCRSGNIPANIISPHSYVSPSASLGNCIFIGHNAHIGPEASIGDASIINTHAIIEHECSIGNNTHIAIGALVAGRVRIGNSCFIGAGAIIRDSLNVSDNIIVGAGSVVVKNLIDNGVYFGVPAMKKSFKSGKSIN